MNSGVVIVGFDSAWTDNPRKPGAICSMTFAGNRAIDWQRPQLVTFDEALKFIRRAERPEAALLVALDQPTIVPNETGSRPVDKVAGSVISWMGGGVQPANRGRLGMFDDAAPVWRFVDELSADQRPEDSRSGSGRYLIEVFPALALAAMDARFFSRLSGPRYNPERRRTFTQANWRRVLTAVETEARRLGCTPAAKSVADLEVENARKEHQDRLDAIICLLVGVRWRFEPRCASVIIGSLDRGYMVSPVTNPLRGRLLQAAAKRSVPVDGAVKSTATAP